MREPAQRDRVVLAGAARSGGLRRRGGARPATRRRPSRSPPPAPRRPVPAAIASRTGSWSWSRACASSRRRFASRLVCRVVLAHQAAVSVAPWFAPRSRRSAWLATRSSSSASRCRNAATEARVSASSVSLIDQSRGSPSWSRSAWNRATRAATGCASGSPNTVAIQGILASTTDSPGPRTGVLPACGQVFSECFWSGRCRGLDKLDQRGVALDHRSDSATATATYPGADRDPAPYLSRRCAFPPPDDLQPRGWSRHSLAGARCSTTGDHAVVSTLARWPIGAVSSPRQIRPGGPATSGEGGLTSETCQRPSTNASQPSSRRFSRTPRNCRRCRGSTSRR